MNSFDKYHFTYPSKYSILSNGLNGWAYLIAISISVIPEQVALMLKTVEIETLYFENAAEKRKGYSFLNVLSCGNGKTREKWDRTCQSSYLRNYETPLDSFSSVLNSTLWLLHYAGWSKCIP